MSFIVYILYSGTADRYYIGHTADITDRLRRHNNSGSKATKHVIDWMVVYTEEFPTKSDAYKREREIKSKKSRKYIKSLVGSSG